MKYTQQQILEALKAYKNGTKNVEQIASELKCHPQNVYYWLKKSGIDRGKRGRSPINWNNIKESL